MYWMLIQGMYNLLENMPQPCKYCHPDGIVVEPSYSDSMVLLTQLLQDGGKHGKTSEFHEYGPIATLQVL